MISHAPECAHINNNACHSAETKKKQLIKQRAAHQVDGRLLTHFPLPLGQLNSMLFIEIHLLQLCVCVCRGQIEVRVTKKEWEWEWVRALSHRYV